MIEGENKVLQAFLGTLMTWALTAAGSALVFVFSAGRCSAGKRKILDGSLGFAAGVMTAASFWSLLAPAIEKAENSGYYGKDGKFAFGPVAIGFALGGLFVYISDKCIPHLAGKDPAISLAMHQSSHDKKSNADNDQSFSTQIEIINSEERAPESESLPSPSEQMISDEVELKVRNRKVTKDTSQVVLQYEINSGTDKKTKRMQQFESWKRMLLLIIAITVHNIPEGLAVGVSFGAIGSSKEATFQSARNLAIGIGIQNFPEGMAVSVPLCAAGYSPLKSFWYGQLSGMVEPIFGVLGALIVIVAEPLLPYALAFAAGAMIYVVVDDIIPEANIWKYNMGDTPAGFSLANLFSYENLTHAVSGATGSVVGMTTFYPLDTVRTRLQADDNLKAIGPFQAIKQLSEEEGVETLYRGLKPVLVSLYCSNFVYFYTFNGMKAMGDANGIKASAPRDLIFGYLSGCVNALVTTPLWVVNTRLKLQGVVKSGNNAGNADVSDGKQLTGLIDGLRRIAKEEGIGALWNGLQTSFILSGNPAIHFMVYDALKRLVLNSKLAKGKKAILSSLESFLLGGFAKAVATVLTYPLQLIQCRQRAKRNAGSQVTMAHIANEVIRQSGLLGLYKGMESKLFQTVLTAALMFLAYEKISALIAKLFRVKKAIKK